MYPATTFTNNGTGAGEKQKLNLVSWQSGVHCHMALFALLYAACCEWDPRAAASSPNVASIYGYPFANMKDLIQSGVNVYTAAGVITKYRVSPSNVCAFAGTGVPTNGTKIEGFVLDIRIGTSGEDTIAGHYSFFVPFYICTTPALDTNAAAFDVGNILASA